MDPQTSKVPPQLRLELCDFLSAKLGLFFSVQKNWPDLEKKIQLAAKAFEFDESIPFIKWLLHTTLTQTQTSLLAQYLTVGETYFFRDPHSFAMLKNSVLPELIATRLKEKKRFLKIASIGCCTGEEAYSLAILLDRLIPDLNEWNLTLMGIDINLSFLNRAEEGLYKKWSFRSVDPEIQRSYFIPDGDAYRIIPRIKKMVKFKYFNLADSNQKPLDLAEMDLILCNNVLIYFSSKQIQASLQRLSDLLREGGALLVTSVEVPFVNIAELTPHRFKESMVFKKEKKIAFEKTASEKKIPEKAALFFSPILETLPISIKEHPKNKVSDHLLALYHGKQYTFLILELEGLLSPLKNSVDELKKNRLEILLLIQVYANQGNSLSALEWCDALSDIETLDPLIPYLKGTILQELSSESAAMISFKKALDRDPHFIPALFSLGNMEMQSGNQLKAIEYLKQTLELLNKMNGEERLAGMEGITARQLREIILATPNLKASI